MNQAEKGIPERTTWAHMMVRFDSDPKFIQREGGWGEVKLSRQVVWPKGMELPKRNPNQLRTRPATPDDEKTVCAIFLLTRPLRDRLLKLGWVEVTREYDDWVALQKQASRKKEDVIAPAFRGPKPAPTAPKVKIEDPPVVTTRLRRQTP